MSTEDTDTKTKGRMGRPPRGPLKGLGLKIDARIAASLARASAAQGEPMTRIVERALRRELAMDEPLRDKFSHKAEKRGDIEICPMATTDPDLSGDLDEVWGSNCSVHLEEMDDNEWWLGITDKHGYRVSVLFCSQTRIEALAVFDQWPDAP